jgi:hypothetical protein
MVEAMRRSWTDSALKKQESVIIGFKADKKLIKLLPTKMP